MTCNTRRSGTASPMSGSCSTPTATASRRSSSTTAIAPASTSSGRSSTATAQVVDRAGRASSARRARRRQHGGARHAGPRRDDRPRRPFRPRREMVSLRRADARHGGRQGRGRGGRLRLPAHRLRPGRCSRWARTRTRRSSSQSPARRSTAATRGCCSGSPTSGLVALISDNYRGRGACRRAPARARILRHAAAARALPVQARRQSRRDLAA